ncbi:MAG: hypothetical protein ACJAU2_001840 [Maribacter sp.]|jgi:hypothetical protein
MSEIIFRNYDLTAIRQLLKEVGKERYECALKDQGIEQKPLGMNGFFVEFEVDTKDINLYYKYPSKVTLFIMPVLGFWGVPIDEWVLTRK